MHAVVFLTVGRSANRPSKYGSHVGIIKLPPVEMYGVYRPFYQQGQCTAYVWFPQILQGRAKERSSPRLEEQILDA